MVKAITEASLSIMGRPICVDSDPPDSIDELKKVYVLGYEVDIVLCDV